jgi:hypothetical protein
LIIGLGDIVNWSWNLPPAITGLKFKVEQVLDPTAVDPIGFSSGDATATGI